MGGCLLGCLGLLVTCFGIYFIHQGTVSQRPEEIDEYVKSVKAWTSVHQERFKNLDLNIVPLSKVENSKSTKIEKIVGKLYSDQDIQFALGRIEQRHVRTYSGNNNEMEADFAPSATDGKRILKEVEKNDDLVIDYIPLKQEITFTPNKLSLFLPTMFTTEPKKHFGNVRIEVFDKKTNTKNILEHKVALLNKEERFTKSPGSCRGGAAVKNHHCTWYKMLTKVCMVVDYLPNAETGVNEWQATESCGTTHAEKLPHSSNFNQAMEFSGFPMTIEVRSAKDPHVLFGDRTKNLYALDEDAVQSESAGLILLIFGIIMMIISMYKTYRYCLKYIFKDYYRK